MIKTKDSEHKCPPGPCPLCLSTDVQHFATDKFRDFLSCKLCQLVFVPPQFHLSAADEKIRYDLHQNSPEDLGYTRFLNQLSEPLSKLLTPSSSGLDFGSGPGPTLSGILQAQGFAMEIFDPFYTNQPELLTRQYDFITSTEVLEHLRTPRMELDRLWSCLKPGGHLGVMTRLLKPETNFSKWRYRDDDTHLCFYRRETVQWLAKHLNATLDFETDQVFILRKALS